MGKDKKFQQAANRHGRAAVASMRDDLDALEHAQECDGTNENGKPCKRGSETRSFKLKDGTKGKQNKHQNPDAWHDEERAREAIEQGHYGIELRGGWYAPGGRDEDGAQEYCVTLGGGGPAMRIVGELEDGSPSTARYQFQDWFKPWTDAELSEKESAILLQWVGHLYFED